MRTSARSHTRTHAPDGHASGDCWLLSRCVEDTLVRQEGPEHGPGARVMEECMHYHARQRAGRCSAALGKVELQARACQPCQAQRDRQGIDGHASDDHGVLLPSQLLVDKHPSQPVV